MLNSFILKLRIYKFFDDFVIIYPLYTLMFESNGVSLSHISILLLTWSITSFVLEIPSGAFADIYDRKSILVFAQICRVIGFSIWLLFPIFWGFLIGFILWGIKSALTSGTLEAFLYDDLNIEGKEREYAKELGKLKSFSFVAILMASTLASLLFFAGYKIILILSIVALLLSIFVLSTIESKKNTRSTQEVKYLSVLSEGIQEIWKNRSMLILVLVSASFVGAMAIDEYLALYIDKTSIPISIVGYLFALYSLIQTIGSFIAHRFESKNILFPLLISFTLIIMLIGVVSGVVGVILFMVLAIASTIGQVVSNSAIQKIVKGHIRATINSSAGFFAEILAFIVYIVFWLLPSEEVKLGFRVFGGVALTMSIILTILDTVKNRSL